MGVPFDLYISRASSFDVVRGEPATDESAYPAALISADEFHSLMGPAPATRKGDALYWVRHPEGDPWFAIEWTRGGHVRLSASYTHHRFLRNLGDMFDQALGMAAALEARLIEEVGGREVAATNIDGLMDPKGEYVALQAATWRHAVELLDERGHAPLEYPLGAIDSVSEPLVVHVVPERPSSFDSVRIALARDASGTRVEAVNEVALCLLGADDRRLAKVLLRPDGRWQIWPWHGQAPFARVAATVLRAAETIEDAVGGHVFLQGRPFDDALRRDVRARIDGLSVDFYTWQAECEAQAAAK
jgi:hypothetical protein